MGQVCIGQEPCLVFMRSIYFTTEYSIWVGNGCNESGELDLPPLSLKYDFLDIQIHTSGSAVVYELGSERSLTEARSYARSKTQIENEKRRFSICVFDLA